MAMRPAPEMYPVTQSFYADATAYNYGAGHGAVDIGVPPGTPLVAPEDGVVVFDGWVWDLPGGPYDYHLRFFLIKPDRGDTRTGGGIVTIFRNAIGSHWYIAHAGESYFYVGDRVRKGDVLQLSGDTGSSTGPHSHVGLFPPEPDYSNGFFGGIDPAPYLTEKYWPTRRVSWQGGPTEGVGATTTTKKDWFDMADKNTLKAALRELIPEIVDAVLDEPVRCQGTDPETGKQYAGYSSLRNEVQFGTFRGFRDRRIEDGVNAIADAVRPSTLDAVVRGAITTDQKEA